MSDENITPGKMKPFNLNKPHYDQSTFGGRFRHFLDVADPRCLAPSIFFGMSLDESVKIIDQYKSKTLPANFPNDKLWLAKKIKTSAIHPDTNETILQPFRMSGFAIYGTPIIVGMLVPNPTMAATVFWQAINQTHNACINYSNRNASHPVPMSRLLQGYGGAVASSVGIAVGLNELVKRAKVSPAVRTMLSRFVPYPAVATASTCNMLLMRRSELSTGIHVKDHNGEVVGTSQIAAEKAITQTAITRIVLPAPLLVFPPVVMMSLEKTRLFKVAPRLRLPVEALLCATAFIFGLPFAISMFPQDCEMEVKDLEPRFHNLVDSSGKPITSVVFNKGL